MKHIFISAGHSDADPGACANGLREADVVTEFRDMVAHYLAEAGVTFTRDGSKGENLTLKQAIAMMPSRGISVEFHLNAAENKQATGVESLSRDNLKPLGEKLCAAISERLSIKNRGANGESAGQHTRLAFVSAGGLILELFFVTNVADVESYKAKKWLVAKDVAQILIDAAKE